jgi:hypothetical protein
LSSVYIALGDYKKAAKWLEKGLATEAGPLRFEALLAGIQTGAMPPANGGNP